MSGTRNSNFLFQEPDTTNAIGKRNPSTTVVKTPVKTDVNEQTPLIAHTTHSRPAEHETRGEKEKGDENHNQQGVHVVVPPPTSRRTTIAIRANLIGEKGIRKLDLRGKEGRQSNHM